MADEKPRPVRSQVRIDASPEKVWAALVEPEQIRQWWGARHGLVEPHKGGSWALAWGEEGQGYRFVLCGVIRGIQPMKRLRIEPLVYLNAEHPVPGPMRLSFSLTPKEGLTRLVIRLDPRGDERGWAEYREGASKGWQEALANLKRFLEKAD